MSSIFTVNTTTDLVWPFQGTQYAIKRFDSALGGEGAQELDILNYVNGEWDRFAVIKGFTNDDVAAAGGVVLFLVAAIALANALFKLRGLDPDANTTPPPVVPDPTLSISAQIDQTIPYLFGVETTATGIRLVQKVLPGATSIVTPPAAASAGTTTAAGAIPADLAAAIAAGTPSTPTGS